jgi:hypothetical protein
LRNHALHPQPDVALALFLVLPILRRVDGRQLEGNRIMLTDRREAVHANADGGHVALLGQLSGTLGNAFRRAPSRFCTMVVARLREPGGRPAGFPLWPFRNWGILLTPLLVLRFGVRGGGGQKTLCVWGAPRRWGPQKPRRFWGASRPRNEKPGAVSRAGLGYTPEGYLFILESRFNVQKSQVASHKLHRNHKLHHA